MFFICTPLMEHSLEPVAEIQIALDHFPMVYISICSSSSAHLLLFQRLFPFPFLFLSFFPFFVLIVWCVLSHRGVWNACMPPCILLTHLVAALHFYVKSPLPYIAVPVVSLFKHMVLTLHKLWANCNWIYLQAERKCSRQAIAWTSL